MITCDLKGGLGNQLFQIFTTIAYSIKTKNCFKFPNVETLGEGDTTLRLTYWKSFLSSLKPFLISETSFILKIFLIEIVKERNFKYNELTINETPNIMLSGYFQSYKYFEKNYYEICKLIGIEKMKKTLIQKLKKNTEYEFNDSISLHFRLGDYKYRQAVHPLATLEYYQDSLSYIKNVYPDILFTVLFFCEDEDIDDVLIKINCLKSNFPNYVFIRGDNTLSDWEQMLYMSICKHNIIANSSFSWWGAYFNSKNEKIVCYPSIWFGPKIEHDTSDLCPPNWIKI